MSDDAQSWLMGNSTPSASFLEVGRTYEGQILELRMVQQRDFATKKPKFWDDGDPMMQAAITIRTDERDENIPHDDGKRVVYAKARMRDAIREAVTVSGHDGPLVGGTLKVQYVGDDDETRAKLYRAKFVPGVLEPVTEGLEAYGDEEPF